MGVCAGGFCRFSALLKSALNLFYHSAAKTVNSPDFVEWYLDSSHSARVASQLAKHRQTDVGFDHFLDVGWA